MRRRWGWWISEESLSAFQALGSVLSRRNMMITSTAITSSPASNSVVSNKTCAIGTFPTLTTKPLPAGRATAPTTLHNPHATSKGSALAPETTQPRLPLQNRQQKRAGGLEIGAQDFTYRHRQVHVAYFRSISSSTPGSGDPSPSSSTSSGATSVQETRTTMPIMHAAHT